MKDRVEKLEIKIEEVGSEMKELRTILKSIQETLDKFSNAIIEMTKHTIRLNKTEKDINKLFKIVREDEESIEKNGKDRLKFGLQIALGAVSASFAICMGALGYILVDVKYGVRDIKTLSETVVQIDKKLNINDFKLDGMNKLIMDIKHREDGSR